MMVIITDYSKNLRLGLPPLDSGSVSMRSSVTAFTPGVLAAMEPTIILRGWSWRNPACTWIKQRDTPHCARMLASSTAICCTLAPAIHIYAHVHASNIRLGCHNLAFGKKPGHVANAAGIRVTFSHTSTRARKCKRKK